MQDNIIIRAKKYRALVESIGQNAVAVTLHADDADFTILDLYAIDPRRLNKSPREAVGKPAAFIAAAISEPRIHALKKASANGNKEVFSYAYADEDNGLEWLFQSAVAPIYGSQELICITSDLREWQKHYWLHKFISFPQCK